MTTTNNNNSTTTTDDPPSLVVDALNRLTLVGLDDEAPKSPDYHSAMTNRASVLVLVSRDGKVLLTQRAKHLKAHPGEICLPGGTQDEEDGGDDIVTALRETKEETGLDFTTGGNDIKLLCRLPSVIMPGRRPRCVSPFVALHTTKTAAQLQEEIKINTNEVEQALWVPLLEFTKLKQTIYPVPWDWQWYPWREFNFDNNSSGETIKIFGFTAGMVYQTAHLVASPQIPLPISLPFSPLRWYHQRQWTQQLAQQLTTTTSTTSSSTTANTEEK